jgi:carbamoyltransferase
MLSKEAIAIVLCFFYPDSDPEALLRRLMNVKGVQRTEWHDNVLTLIGDEEVVKLHRTTLEINELCGLKDRFYVKSGDDCDEVVVKIYHRDFRDEIRPGDKPVYVLGAVRNSHDSGAALIKNGLLIGAIEEERLTLNKHEAAYFPKESVRYLLDVHGIIWDDLAHIAITYDYNFYRPAPRSKAPDFLFREKHHLPLPPTGVDRRYDTDQLQSFLETLAHSYGSGYIPPVTFVKHHKCHAVAAYHASGFMAPTLVVTIDGQGEDESSTVWIGTGGTLKKIAATTPFIHSLGHFYHIFTIYLGYRRYDEGKVMGFAPYGVPANEEEAKTVSQLRKMIAPLIRFNRKTCRIEMDRQYLVPSADNALPGINLSETFLDDLDKIVPRMPPEKNGSNLVPEDRKSAHLAYVVQERTEQVVMDIVDYYLNEYPDTMGVEHVVLAGGLALNIMANGRLIKEGRVKPENLFIPAYPADEGTAVGAALSVSAEEYSLDTHRQVSKVSFGKTYSDASIQEVLNRFGLTEGTDYDRVQTDEKLVEKVADSIVKNETVAWFQGGAELGPRALGNRSLLHRLDDLDGNLKVNRIKRREFWRPSALSVQEERAAEFLEGISTSPFMTIAFPVVEGKKQLIKAGIHPADGTTRPQTVSRKTCPLFWSLLDEIGKRTGIPAVLNTSFNRGSPIVETPEMALNTFFYSEGLNLLAIGHFIVKRKDRIVPNILNGRDEPLLKNFFLSGNDLATSDTASWDDFWEAAVRLVTLRAASAPHFLIVTMKESGKDREILKVPLLKEMFQKGTREHIIADLARRIQREIQNCPSSIVDIRTTAPHFQEIIWGLFQKFAPDDVMIHCNSYSYVSEWLLRSLLGRTSRAPLTDEDIQRFFRQGIVRLETMLYQCVLRPGHLHHSKRLKKDLPIRAVNQPYTPVIGNAIVEKMVYDLNERFDLRGIIENYRQEGKKLMIIGKGHGGLILGLSVAEKLNLPFLPLTKNPFAFAVESTDNKILISAEEPHLPKDSPILFSNMLVEPGIGVIIVDDEATSGLVHRNTIGALCKYDVVTELVAVLLKASDRSRKEMEDLHIPFYYMTEAETKDDAPLTNPEMIPFGDFHLAGYPVSPGDEACLPNFSFVQYATKTGNGFFIDHPLRGMTIPLEPVHFAAAKRMTKETFEQLVDLRKIRRETAMRGQSLFIVGTTPSGLHTALAASMSLNLPLVSASTRPEPIGFEDVVNYIGLDGYTYSIFGLTPGDAILLVTGELTDGEEQRRIVKALRDNQISVEAHVAVMENTHYDGSNAMKSTGIPSAALLKQNFKEDIRILNTTEKARACLVYALDNLSRAIKTIHPGAAIMEVKALPSSFTRGIMMERSDMDEIFIFVEGISQAELDDIYPRFIKWMECPHTLYVDDHSNIPVLISEESRLTETLKHSVNELFLVDLLRNEFIKPMAEIAKESNRLISVFLYDKTIARIKLLLYLEELSEEHVRTLLEAEDPTGEEFNNLVRFLENYRINPLSPGVRSFALQLDHSYTTGRYTYVVDDLDLFVSNLEELNNAGIIRVYETRILPVWRMHSGRVSTRFWERQIQVVAEKETQEALSRRMAAVAASKTETALRQATHHIPSQGEVTEDILEDILNVFDESPTLISIAACDLIMKYPRQFFPCIRQRILNRTPMNVKTGFTYQERIAISWLVTMYMRIGQTSDERAHATATFVYERFITGQEKNPQSLPHLVMLNIIENFPFIVPLIKDDTLLENIRTSLLKMCACVSLRIANKAKKILSLCILN